MAEPIGRSRFAGASASWIAKLAFVWGGQLVSVLTSSILQMGFVWHITLTTNSASMLSLASLAGFLPLALFGTFAGAIVDRLPLRVTLVGADLFIAAVSAVVAAVSSLFADAVGAPAWFVGAGAAMAVLACVTWAIPAIRRIESAAIG